MSQPRAQLGCISTISKEQLTSPALVPSTQYPADHRLASGIAPALVFSMFVLMSASKGQSQLAKDVFECHAFITEEGSRWGYPSGGWNDDVKLGRGYKNEFQANTHKHVFHSKQFQIDTVIGGHTGNQALGFTWTLLNFQPLKHSSHIIN